MSIIAGLEDLAPDLNSPIPGARHALPERDERDRNRYRRLHIERERGPDFGNPATHMPLGLGGCPGMTSVATKTMKKQIAGLDVSEVPEFLEMLIDMMDLDSNDLGNGVEDLINVSDFIKLSEAAQILFM
tara:strand:+ start:83 stop:472 length:390 start_codon:yes stop_codon:yes gene_type:complete